MVDMRRAASSAPLGTFFQKIAKIFKKIAKVLINIVVDVVVVLVVVEVIVLVVVSICVDVVDVLVSTVSTSSEEQPVNIVKNKINRILLRFLFTLKL